MKRNWKTSLAGVLALMMALLLVCCMYRRAPIKDLPSTGPRAQESKKG